MPHSLFVADDLLGMDARMMRRESLQAMSRGAGASAILTRMAALMLSLTLRMHPQCSLLFRLSAEENPIARALQLINADLSAEWSIGRLARSVGMSRSSFAAHFVAQVGRPPMEVVTEQRMHKASNLLQSTDLKLAEIGEKVGYKSETSFCRRFKQFFRLSPGQMRKMARAKTGRKPQAAIPPGAGGLLAHGDAPISLRR
jgi:transcriptional regulator GlxA family with amidase domain